VGASIFAFVNAALIVPLPDADQSKLVLACGTAPERAFRRMGSHIEHRDSRGPTTPSARCQFGRTPRFRPSRTKADVVESPVSWFA
jgi:hypothetical protein